VEPLEYKTMPWTADDAAGMLDQLNELGAQGWEVCAQGNARVGSELIGRLPPGLHEVQLLLLKRHKTAVGAPAVR
jgi:hypothetical protein